MELAIAHKKIRHLSAPLLMRDIDGHLSLLTVKTEVTLTVLHDHALSVLVGRRGVI